MIYAKKINEDYGYDERFYIAEFENTMVAIPATIPVDLLKILPSLTLSAPECRYDRLRIYYGDPITGRTGGENFAFHDNYRHNLSICHDVWEGYLFPSFKTDKFINYKNFKEIKAHYLMLVPYRNSKSGYILNVQNIVCIECSNMKNPNKGIWKHPRFHNEDKPTLISTEELVEELQKI